MKVECRLSTLKTAFHMTLDDKNMYMYVVERGECYILAISNMRHMRFISFDGVQKGYLVRLQTSKFPLSISEDYRELRQFKEVVDRGYGRVGPGSSEPH